MEDGPEEQPEFSYRQRLKAAVHYTAGCLCEEVASDKEVQFSRQTIAAISELTFRQCENFARDLEMFARHARRSTINTEDVKLLARRNHSLLKYITEKNEEITQCNLERKTKKKKKSEDEGHPPSCLFCGAAVCSGDGLVVYVQVSCHSGSKADYGGITTKQACSNENPSKSKMAFPLPRGRTARHRA